MTTPQPTVLKLAVCLSPLVATLDFAGAMEFFGLLSINLPNELKYIVAKSPYALDTTYISLDLEPVQTLAAGPLIIPARSYDDILKTNEQFDILLVPGGAGFRPNDVPPSLLEFLKRQAAGAKYILGVCVGASFLAQAGILDGKRATTSKSQFKVIQEATKHLDITWVGHARWVVDGKIWTSSGVSAGIDMTCAFLDDFVGVEVSTAIRNIIEYTGREEGDDEFAAIFGVE